MSVPPSPFALQLAATAALTGLIWMVQLVHYPLFAHAAGDRFPEFHRAHQFRISWLVVPLMTIEAACASLWLSAPPETVGRPLAIAGFALVIVIWLSTALLQIPQHRKLGRGWDPDAHRRLVAGNWVRTVAWTARLVLLLVVLERTLS